MPAVGLQLTDGTTQPGISTLSIGVTTSQPIPATTRPPDGTTQPGTIQPGISTLSLGVTTSQPIPATTRPPDGTTQPGIPTLSVVPGNVTASVSSPSHCYYPNGQINSIDIPCDPNASVSMCCSDRALCLSNGLCRTTNDPPTDKNLTYARGTCTDNQWGSSICPQHCLSNQDSATNFSAYKFRGGSVQVWECGGSQAYSSSADYCCESEGEKTRCCSTPTAIFKLGPATVGNFASSTSSSLAPTLASPASSFTAPSATATGTSSPQQKIAAGGVAGGVIGGVALLAMAVLIWRFWSKRRKTKNMPRSSWVKPELSADPRTNHSNSGFPYELNANPKRPPEFPDHSRYELQGDLDGSELMTLGVGSKGR